MSGAGAGRGPQLTLKLKVIPSASVNRIVGFHGEELVVKIKAAPDKGKANKELIDYLARTLKIPKRRVVIVRGQAARHKTVMLPAAAASAFMRPPFSE